MDSQREQHWVESKKDLLFISNKSEKNKLRESQKKVARLQHSLKSSANSRRQLAAQLTNRNHAIAAAKQKTSENLHKLHLAVTRSREQNKALSHELQVAKHSVETKEKHRDAEQKSSAEKYVQLKQQMAQLQTDTTAALEKHKASEAALTARIGELESDNRATRAATEAETKALRQSVEKRERVIAEMDQQLTTRKREKRALQNKLEESQRKIFFAAEKHKLVRNEVDKQNAEIAELKDIIHSTAEEHSSKTEDMIQSLTDSQSTRLEQLSSELATLVQCNADLVADNRALTLDNNNLKVAAQHQSEQTQHEIEKQLSIIDKYESQLSLNTDEMDKLRNEHAAFKQQCDLKVKQTEHALKESVESQAVLRGEADSVKEQLRLSQEKHSADVCQMQTEKKTEAQTHSKVVEKLKETIQQLERNTATARGQLREAELSKESTEKLMAEQQQRSEAERVKDADIQALKLAMKHNENSRLCQQIKATQMQFNTCRQKIATLSAGMEQQKSIDASLKSQLDKALAQIHTDKMESVKHKRAAEAIANEKNQLSREMQEKDIQIKQQQSELADARDDAERKVHTIDSLETQIGNMTALVHGNQSTVAELHETNNAYEGQLALLNEAVELKESQLRDLQESAEMSTKEIEKYKHTTTELRMKIEEQSRDLRDSDKKYSALKQYCKGKLSKSNATMSKINNKLQKYKGIVKQVSSNAQKERDSHIRLTQQRLQIQESQEQDKIDSLNRQSSLLPLPF
jgi:chromosome segregation ATPase